MPYRTAPDRPREAPPRARPRTPTRLLRFLAQQAVVHLSLFGCWTALLLTYPSSYVGYFLCAFATAVILLGLMLWVVLRYEKHSFGSNAPPLLTVPLLVVAISYFGPSSYYQTLRGAAPLISVRDAPQHANRCFFTFKDARSAIEHARVQPLVYPAGKYSSGSDMAVVPLVPPDWQPDQPVPAWLRCGMKHGEQPASTPDCRLEHGVLWEGVSVHGCVLERDDHAQVIANSGLRSAPGAPVLRSESDTPGVRVLSLASVFLALLFLHGACLFVPLRWHRREPAEKRDAILRALTNAVAYESHVDWEELQRMASRAGIDRDTYQSLVVNGLSGIQPDHLARLSHDRTAPLEWLRELSTRSELAWAADRRDMGGIHRALQTARDQGEVAHDDAAVALSAVLDHGSTEDISRAYTALSSLVTQESPTTGHVAFNMACAAARLRRKDEMLAWLRAADRAGDPPRDALEHPDFAAWAHDPDLLRLANGA